MKRLALREVLEASPSGFWGTNPGEADEDVSVIRNGDVKPGAGIRWAALPERGFTGKEAAKSRVRSGDLILTTSGDCGVTAMVENEPASPTCASNFVRILRPNTDVIDPRYLFHYTQTAGFLAALQPFIRGTTLKNLSTREAFVQVDVPTPAMGEQRRVAAILDHADALRAKRAQALAHLDDLTTSIFHDMFGSRSELASRWPTRPLASVARTTSGGTPDRSNADLYGGEIPWVKSGELSVDPVVATEETLTERGLAESSAKLMPPGTVLVAMYGATAGRVSTLGVEASTNQAVCGITPGVELRASFLVTVLRTRSGELLSKRTGGAQPNLSQGLLRALELPIPPISLQSEFEDRLVACQHIQARKHHSAGELQRLSDALAADFFGSRA